jgi:hypothetical protein
MIGREIRTQGLSKASSGSNGRNGQIKNKVNKEKPKLARTIIRGDGLLQSVLRLGHILKQTQGNRNFLISRVYLSMYGSKICETVR